MTIGQRPSNLSVKTCSTASLAFGLVIALSPAAHAAEPTLKQISDTYASQVIATGQAIGVGVAIIEGDRPARFFNYGNAVQATPSAPATPFNPDLLFSIGSVTKVFTTNLLGQRVFTGKLDLQQPLSDFSTELGTLKPLTSQITLKQLASFTGGIADFAPRCGSDSPHGCLPPEIYPNLQQYPVDQLVAFFQHTVPYNYRVTPAQRVKRLPAPYNYSDFAVGLTGLLLGGSPQKPLDNTAVNGWFRAVKNQILEPLQMTSTFLWVPADEAGRKIAGYSQALATATVTNGTISGITINSRGNAYSAPPAVTITGGGGTGATATATLGPQDRITGITVTQGGGGYVAPPTIVFSNGGSTTTPNAQAVIANGQVTAVYVRGGGAGLQQVPTVAINGGLLPGGQPAQLEAEIANGRVTFIRVINPGSGYADPLSVGISAGAPYTRPVTAWAPSGFIWSSLRDMAVFAKAALAEQSLSPTPQQTRIREGFKIAERGYVCIGDKPWIGPNCPLTLQRGGLAWQIQPADPVTGFPRVISKDGGVPGYSTYVTLMRGRRLAVVVFVNSTAQILGQTHPTAPASTIASNILNAIYYGRSPATESE